MLWASSKITCDSDAHAHIVWKRVHLFEEAQGTDTDTDTDTDTNTNTQRHRHRQTPDTEPNKANKGAASRTFHGERCLNAGAGIRF